MKKPLAWFVEASTNASRDPKGHVGAHDAGSVRPAMAGVVHTSPGYTRDELEQDARRILEYVQPALHPDAQRMAGTDADMRLLPVLLQHDRLTAEHLDTLLQTAHMDKDAAMSRLQDAESQLRECVNDVLRLHGAPTSEDDDDDDLLTSSIEPLMALLEDKHPKHTQDIPKTDESGASEQLASLYAARACTQLLADAEETQRLAASSPINALVQLSALAEDAPQRGPRDCPMLMRTMSCLTQSRDALCEQIKLERTEALRTAFKQAAWPPPAYQSPETMTRDTPAYHLLGHPAVELAWADVCEWQFTAATIGLIPSPSCITAPATVTGTSDCLNASCRDAAPGSDTYVPLLAVQVMMEQILLRFRYHFDGARSTNRLDKPEWFLAHILGLIQVLGNLFEASPDPWTPGGDVAELTRRRRDTSLAEAPLRQRYVAVDAPSELLHALLYPARRKIQASMHRLVCERALLAHNIYQFITFDADLRDTYAPARVSAISLADEILAHETWFQSWLDGERAFTEQRFVSLMEKPGAWNLVQADTMDDEGVASTTLSDEEIDVDTATTTRCACSLVHMLTGVTEQYKPLHSLPQRCAFIIKVQRPLLDMMHHRLVRHLDAFENMSTAFSRALPGDIASFSSGPGNELVRGEHGVTRVAKALLSADYIKKQLQEWSESTFFLGMAQDIAELDTSSPLYRLMALKSSKDDLDSASLMSVLQRGIQRGASAAAQLRPLSSAAKEEPAPQPNQTEETDMLGIWDYYVAKFEIIATRSAHALERLTVAEVLDLLKPYILRRWDHDEPVDDQETASQDQADQHQDIPTRELIPALSKLTTMLQHMVQVLPPNLLLPVYRHIAASLSHAIVERVLMPNARFSQQFTASQAQRFCLDVKQGWLHVAQEIAIHPKVSARQAKGIPTGLGRDPATAWRVLVDASKQLELS